MTKCMKGPIFAAALIALCGFRVIADAPEDDIQSRAAAQAKELKDLLQDKTLSDDKRRQALDLASQALSNYADLLVADKGRETLLKLKIEALGGRPAFSTYLSGTKINITTLDGKVYANATAKTWNAHSVTLLTDDGGATVPFNNLPRDVQDEFGYDPALDTQKPPAAASPRTGLPSPDAPAASDETPTSTISGGPIEPGLNIVGADAKIVEVEDADDKITWKAVLYNNSDAPITDIWVTFTFADKDDFELDHDLNKVFAVKPHESFTLTGTRQIKAATWAKVSGYRVKTE